MIWKTKRNLEYPLLFRQCFQRGAILLNEFIHLVDEFFVHAPSRLRRLHRFEWYLTVFAVHVTHITASTVPAPGAARAG